MSVKTILGVDVIAYIQYYLKKGILFGKSFMDSSEFFSQLKLVVLNTRITLEYNVSE